VHRLPASPLTALLPRSEAQPTFWSVSNSRNTLAPKRSPTPCACCPQELGDVRPDVQDAVAKLCCSWWTAEADNREFLVSQALPYLLVRGVGEGHAHARVWCVWCVPTTGDVCVRERVGWGL
jgi:hypothetical protein